MTTLPLSDVMLSSMSMKLGERKVRNTYDVLRTTDQNYELFAFVLILILGLSPGARRFDHGFR